MGGDVISKADALRARLELPVIGSPMFIVSGLDLVLAQCKAGVVGSFPALNARPAEMLDDWLHQLTDELAQFAEQNPDRKVAPFAVNQIVHASNARLDQDVAACVRHKVPIIITSLRPPADVVAAVHSYGGIVLHDVINLKHAEKAIEQGVDGLILVCGGAGGHAGVLNPFAFVPEVRRNFSGIIAVSGAIATGEAICAAQALGADFVYMGTRFIATKEANAAPGYREMIVASRSDEVVYTPFFTGVAGNYLRRSVVAAGLDPADLPHSDKSVMNFGAVDSMPKKAWRDIWGGGQGVGTIDDVPEVAALIAKMKAEFTAARIRITSGEEL